MPLDSTNVPIPEGKDPFDEHNSKPTPIFFPVGQRKIAWKTKTDAYEEINSHKALIRLNEDGSGVRVLGVVGIGYKLVHNKELFARVEYTMRKNFTHDALIGVKISDSVSGWGKMCYRQYVFPNIKCDIGGPVKSPIAFRMIVQNGYGGSALRIHAGAIEFFCTNGMISGEFQSSYNKHTSGLLITGIDQAIEKAFLTFVSDQQKWKRWAATPVKHQAAMDLFKQLANSDKLTENLSQQYMREQETRGANLWSVYSALTYYASHDDGEFKMRSTVEKQDSAAATMLLRELVVSKWVETKEWKQLETV